MTNNERLLGFLGLCRKAGKMIFGFDMTVEAMQKKNAEAVLISKDCSERTARNIKRIAEETASAKELAKKLAEIEVNFAIEVGSNGKAFGSITAKEIAEELAKMGYSIDKKVINLQSSIKTVGKFEAELKLYKGVSGKLKINVIAK